MGQNKRNNERGMEWGAYISGETKQILASQHPEGAGMSPSADLRLK